ncbi:MAG: acyltransferase [Rikenellaceae bacterium]
MNNTTSPTKSSRIESLDAFRGIASFLIMLTHFVLMVPEVFQVENLGYIYGGLSWKLPYFFTLSGYVLTISFERNKTSLERPYRSFLTSRILRIYPLFLITTLAMYFIKVYFGAGEYIEGASGFFNVSWGLAPTCGNLMHSLTLVGWEDTWLYNGPAWTLPYEMRYAILFPILWWLLRKSWLTAILFVAAAYIAKNIASGLESIYIFYNPDFITANLCSMFGFLLFYVGGMLLALNRNTLTNLYLSLKKAGKITVLLITIALMLNTLWVRYIIPSSIYSIASDCLMTLGVGAWIVILVNNRVISSIFSVKPLVALGRSSFSIYLWHTPVFTLLYMLLREHISVWYIIAFSVVLTIVVAQLSFKYLERPVIAYSRRLRR